MARRRKPASQRKTDSIRMLVTKDQRRTLQEAADRAGDDLSTWIRRVSLAAAAK